MFHCRYQPPNLAISTLYWKAWLLLLVVAAFNPQKIGEARYDAVLAFHNNISLERYYIAVIDGFRFGSVGWLPHSENAHGDGYDKVSVLHIMWECGFMVLFQLLILSVALFSATIPTLRARWPTKRPKQR